MEYEEAEFKLYEMSNYKLGLVLAGGGVKGAAHLGVMKAMIEHGIEASVIAGTSAGALAAAFYAANYHPEEVLELFADNSNFTFNAFSLSQPGLLNTEKFEPFLKRFFGEKTFDDLDKELQVMATDIIEGSCTTFSSGSIVKPLLASCAFPFLFSPLEIGDSLYCDGGIVNNFPVEVVKEKVSHTLGVYISPLKKIRKDELSSTANVMDRIYRISNRYASIEKLKDCDWVINPPEMEKYGTFTMNKMREIYDIGYSHGSSIMPKIKEQLADTPAQIE